MVLQYVTSLKLICFSDNQKVIFEFAKYDIPGLPDGMLIDTDNYLWIAVIHGSRVIQIDPEKSELLQTIMIPTPQVSHDLCQFE